MSFRVYPVKCCELLSYSYPLALPPYRESGHGSLISVYLWSGHPRRKTEGLRCVFRVFVPLVPLDCVQRVKVNPFSRLPPRPSFYSLKSLVGEFSISSQTRDPENDNRTPCFLDRFYSNLLTFFFTSICRNQARVLSLSHKTKTEVVPNPTSTCPSYS